MKILMVVAPKDFRDEEFFEPKEIFQKAGLQIAVASKGVREAQGLLGGFTPVDVGITQVNLNDYDAVVFVGGPGSNIYFNDSTALELAKSAYQSQKIIGAICIAPSILANAGILEGKKVTAFPSEAENLKAKGAQYTGENLTVDGNIITASGPQAAREFGEKIVEILGLN